MPRKPKLTMPAITPLAPQAMATCSSVKAISFCYGVYCITAARMPALGHVYSMPRPCWLCVLWWLVKPMLNICCLDYSQSKVTAFQPNLEPRTQKHVGAR